MPLVPLTVVQRWYLKTSWVYRHFTYLFKNPLWDKPIPNGFSLCPLFWSALFSLFILRPIIVPSVRAFRWCVRAAHLTDAIRWLDVKVMRVSPCGDRREQLGVNTLAFGAICLAIGFVTSLLMLLLSCVHDIMAGETNVRWLFWLGLLFVVGYLGAIVVNENWTIPTLIYRRAFWAFSVLIAGLCAAIYPTLFVNAWYEMGLFLWSVVSTIASWAYQGLEWVGWLLWNCGGAVVSLWWMYVGFLVCCIAAYWGAVWTDYLYPPTVYHTNWRLRVTRLRVREWVVEQIAYDFHEMDDTPQYEKCLAYLVSCAAVHDAVWSIVDSEAWTKVSNANLCMSINKERLQDIVEKAHAELMDSKQREREADAKLKAQIEHLKHSRYARVLNAVGVSIEKTTKGAWGGARWVGVQVGTFVCYMWELAKARKSRACPYLVFQGPDQNEQPHV